MRIYDLKEKQEYCKEVALLEHYEWGDKAKDKKELNKRIEIKIESMKSHFDKIDYCKLILLDGENLVGFISIFPSDGDERKDLSPWYATMYVKEEYRGRGLSRILNDAITKEAKKRGFKKIYLKSNLVNYYEKFGAKFLEKLDNGENLYIIDL